MTKLSIVGYMAIIIGAGAFAILMICLHSYVAAAGEFLILVLCNKEIRKVR